MKSTGTPASNELHWFDLNIWYQESAPSNGRQGDISELVVSSSVSRVDVYS